MKPRGIRVRMVKPTQAALTSRKLGVVRIGLHAHPRYLEAHGMPRSVAELAHHPIIGFDKNPTVRRLPDIGMPISRELFSFRCDSDLGQFAALRAGFGLGMCQVAIARRERLVPVLPAQVRFELGMWLVMHEDLRRTRRVRLAFEHLAQGLGTYIASQ